MIRQIRKVGKGDVILIHAAVDYAHVLKDLADIHFSDARTIVLVNRAAPRGFAAPGGRAQRRRARGAAPMSLAQLKLSTIEVYRFRKVALYYRYGSFAFRALY